MRPGYPIGLDPTQALVTAPDVVDFDRARGALMGLCVGDALGSTLEFTMPSVTPLPRLVRGPHQDMVGLGPFTLEPGQVTDDTQMACCLAASLMSKGELDLDDVAARYLGWRLHAFDIGQQTTAALSQIVMGMAPEIAGQETWLEGRRQQAGNGSLMRTVPIGVFFADQPERRRLASLRDSAITHFDPRCQLACAVYNAAIAEGIVGEPDPRQMLDAARAELEQAVACLAGLYPAEQVSISAAQEDLRADLDAASDPDPRLYGPELHLLNHTGFVRVSFRLAFWHLMHTGSFELALIDVVNRGGDADTNGAITGALLGAVYGESGIPERWRGTMLDALLDSDTAGPLADAYHPRLLLQMVSIR